MTVSQALEKLSAYEKLMFTYNHASGLMYYDGATVAPRGSVDLRADTLGELARQAITAAGETYHVDLKRLNRIWLEQAGVRQIDVSQDCTACQSARFWSHRRAGSTRGSLANIIMLTAT